MRTLFVSSALLLSLLSVAPLAAAEDCIEYEVGPVSVERPGVTTPSFFVPPQHTDPVSTPGVTTPSTTTPEQDVGPVHVDSFTAPSVTVNPVTVPGVTTPGVTVPSVTVPGGTHTVPHLAGGHVCNPIGPIGPLPDVEQIVNDLIGNVDVEELAERLTTFVMQEMD